MARQSYGSKLCLFMRIATDQRSSSTIIEELKTEISMQKDAALAYIYLDFKMVEWSCAMFTQSVITQLSCSQSIAQKKVKDLWVHCRNGEHPPSMETLKHTLKGIFGALSCAFVVVDALDECAERESLLKLITELHGWHLPSVHVLVTSRRIQDVERALDPTLTRVICVDSGRVESDIRLYVDHRLHSESRFKKWSKGLRERVETILLSKARGM